MPTNERLVTKFQARRNLYMLLKFHNSMRNLKSMLVLVNLTFSRERSCYVLNFHAFIIYQIQEISEENVLRLTCQDLGPSGSSGHGDDSSQELLRTAVCDPSLHIGLAFFTCFNFQVYKVTTE